MKHVPLHELIREAKALNVRRRFEPSWHRDVGALLRECEDLEDGIRVARKEPVLRAELLKLLQAQHGN